MDSATAGGKLGTTSLQDLHLTHTNGNVRQIERIRSALDGDFYID